MDLNVLLKIASEPQLAKAQASQLIEMMKLSITGPSSSP